jgi:hypothetical protein
VYVFSPVVPGLGGEVTARLLFLAYLSFKPRLLSDKCSDCIFNCREAGINGLRDDGTETEGSRSVKYIEYKMHSAS